MFRNCLAVIVVTCAMLSVIGCGDSGKTKIPQKEIPLQQAGPQPAGGGGTGDKAGGKQQKNAPPGTGTVQ
ncbi:MAG: hypothetical protein RMJ88_01225 [Thermogemmata sp.]|nr:hypothetical protein [Thermogemmata sp.]